MWWRLIAVAPVALATVSAVAQPGPEWAGLVLAHPESK